MFRPAGDAKVSLRLKLLGKLVTLLITALFFHLVKFYYSMEKSMRDYGNGVWVLGLILNV